MYDAIVIGAGPSGMMCAITASKNNNKVLIIEKNDVIGKKMRLTGGGRCNITNLKDTAEFVKSLPIKNGRFLFSALSNFNPHDIYHYFESLGIKLKVEDHDRVFPVSDKAIDFVDALKQDLINKNVEIIYNSNVINIEIHSDYKIVKTETQDLKTKNIVIATGGMSYPHTGSTGVGHDIAENLNHSVTELFPTESPIISNDPIITSKELQGISFSNVILSLVDNTKILKSHQADLIITHFGLSGPVALKLSQFVYHYLKDHKEALLLLDVLPNISYDNLIKELKEKRDNNSTKLVKTVFKGFSQNRFIEFILKQIHLNNELKMADLANSQIEDFVKSLKSFEIKAHDVKPISVAFVTGGGVSLKEINPQTMESKIIPGLYFVGEVLDLHGYTGGYNITIALSTGYTAGISIRGEEK
ncbi:MAG: NAD(P)/FAD-dependent oxidoreductase [Haloplasmataceae bacterium]|jgi:predicted Rossmann fold flavoprotein|nr:NAD(P)/FAD-dependent oxidoreductase [Haloplasmataceae bacterium]